MIQWAKQQEPYRKWIALLGLYTGARANEICQLYADDVQQVDEVWCLNIRDNRPDQKLKTANSARLIPIHSSLIAGGFIGFVQERAGGRLFPELPHRQDGYSHLWGQWFSRHRPVDKDFQAKTEAEVNSAVQSVIINFLLILQCRSLVPLTNQMPQRFSA